MSAYAQRADNLRESEIRALFAVASRPEVVSLAGGMPNIKDLPLRELAEGARKLIEQDGAQALQYGGGQGWEPFRESCCMVMAEEHIKADPADVVITTGSQQALDLVTQIFINPGDVILAESPSYVGALSVFTAYQAKVHHVPLDEHGLVPDALDDHIRHVRAQGGNIKFLYTCSGYHNPAGVPISLERRPQIVEICKRHHILILEDNPYGLLGFKGDIYPALYTFNPEGVIYLGTFSKIFAPGLRVGYAVAPPAIKAKLVLAAEAAILSPSMLAQMAIHHYLRDYDWKAQIEVYRAMYQERRDAMIEALQEYLPDCSYTVPEGGFYTWVGLPEGIDAKAMLPRAVTELVAYTSGTAFFSDGQGGDHMRLSFCYPPPEDIREGIRRLARVVDRERELVSMFGSRVIHQPDFSSNAPQPNLP
ncbi:MAG: PLP-dependent aminotransferase family protein [Actinomycetaceae bacterium]|nr:PLP-dependent aminotransferase family protein [Actinomycetaceae bacterium]